MGPNRSKILSILVMVLYVIATEEEDREPSDENVEEVLKRIEALNLKCFYRFELSPRYAKMQNYIWKFFANTKESNKQTQEDTDTGELINIQDEQNRLRQECSTVINDIRQLKFEERIDKANLENERDKIVSDCVHLVDRVCALLLAVYTTSPASPDTKCGEAENAKEKSEELESIKNRRDCFHSYYFQVTRAFSLSAPESVFDEKLEDLVDSIGYDMVDEFKQAYGTYDESQAINNGNEELKSLHTALVKLQAYVTYLKRYNEYKKVLVLANMNQGETFVPANLLNDTLGVKMEKSIVKMIKKAKLNEYAKRELTRLAFDKSIYFMVNQANLNLNVIKENFFDLLNHQNLHKELVRFKYLFNMFNVQGDVTEDIRPNEDGSLISISLQPLHNAFKDLSIVYYRFLLEVIPNNFERQLADAELVTITMQLKQVISKARKALSAVKTIKETDADDNAKLYEKELFDGICKSVSIVYTLQKIGLDHSLYQDEFYKTTNTELQKYTEILETVTKRLTRGETLDIKLLNANQFLDAPVVAGNADNNKTNVSDNDTAILDSMTETYKKINAKFDELRNERIARLKTKDINIDYSGSKIHLESTLAEIKYENVIYEEILEIEHGAVEYIEELKANNLGNIDQDNEGSIIVRNGLVDLLKIIAKIELLDANIEKLEGQYLEMMSKARINDDGTNRPDQLISLAHAQFRVLDVTAEKILLRHKKVKILAQFREFTEQKQDLEGHNIGEIGDGATEAFDVTQFLMRKLKKGQEAIDFNKEPALNRAIEHINNFSKKIEAKAKIDNRNSKCSTKDDLDEDIIFFTEYILQCYIVENEHLPDEVKVQKNDKFLEWLQSHGQAIVEESNRIMNKIDINPDDFAMKRISFDSIKSISLDEDLPDTSRVETNQQPTIEIENEPTVVSLPKKQEVQNDSSSLASAGQTSNSNRSANNPLKLASNSFSSQTPVANGNIATQKQNLVDDRINAMKIIEENANGPDASSLVDQDGANNTKSFLGENADSEFISNTGRLEESLCDSISQKEEENDSDDEQNLISAKNMTVSNSGDSSPENDKNSPVTPEAEDNKSKDKKTSIWGKKIAIAIIAVVAVIVLICLFYSLWHLFNFNK